jgi:hypothetical protein
LTLPRTRVTPTAVLELAENQTIRIFRLEAKYTATRLAALEETRRLAQDFEEAHDKFALLEEEEARLAVQRAESQANVETADDAWDDCVHAFQRRLLDLSSNSTDAPLYRKYFADLPSSVTNMSYHAEIMISKDLERALDEETVEELRAFADRLREKREPLENALVERTRLEVDEARFQNRVAMAKSILNKLRTGVHAALLEIAAARGRSTEWPTRLLEGKNSHIEALDRDGVGMNGQVSILPAS